MIKFFAFVSLLPIALACASDDGRRGSGSTVRDSAGVLIVESRRPVWSAEDGWTISADPIVDIGAVDGPAAYRLYRASSAVRLSDGRLVIANGNLWVADYRVAEDEPSSWNVFAPDGRLLGDVAMPARFEALQIGADFVLGSWVDGLGIEHIRMYRLEGTRR